ncbi:MAG: glycosyltransferase [Cyanobacteria bacterium]|nr:glycosyltransferase [Cyanobacteriota bacterium]MDW8202427.1 glycosyltransferase [Cyanobacteriota bacterium SKYGB_h_bin112]
MGMSQEQPIVHILIPVYNRCAITLACLHQLQQLGVLDRYQIVVVDDGSTDGTTAAIQTAYPTVKVLVGTGDLWWTGAMRLGMSNAWADRAAIVLWLNDDCWPEPGAIEALVEFVHTHPKTIAAAACYSPSGNQPLPTGFRGRHRFAAHPGEVVVVEGTSGYCVAIPRSVMATIGYPDADRFPQYGGDGMYLLAASRAGFTVCILGDAKVRLPGVTDTIYRFRDYLYQLPVPSWYRVFSSKKSPYHLPTRFHYHLTKYGSVGGLSLFLGQTVVWMVQWFIVFITFLGRRGQ